MSAQRKVIFENNEIYHIFNRSVANENILVLNKNIKRFVELIEYYRNEQHFRFSFFNRLSVNQRNIHRRKKQRKYFSLVDVYAYAIMPNHFHILVKQLKTNGIKTCVSNIQNSFAKYFNTKTKRMGPLFQRPFKATHLSTDEEFLHVSRYIHLNPITSYIIEIEALKHSNITSFPQYLRESDYNFVETNQILDLVGSNKHYEKFIVNQIDYQRQLNKIKHLMLEK